VKEADGELRRRVCGFAAPVQLTLDWTATAVADAGRRLEPEEPPPFAVDLLEARIPIEMGCRGSRPPEAARFRAPLTAHFNRKRSLSERSMANCGGRGRRRCGEVALVLPLLGGRHGRLWGRWSRAVAPQFTVTGENPPMQPAAPQGSIRDI
jgi:hypothetical protein